jgi:hypothetical protein
MIDPYSEVGRWWHGEEEINIVGLAPNDDWVLRHQSMGNSLTGRLTNSGAVLGLPLSCLWKAFALYWDYKNFIDELPSISACARGGSPLIRR